MSGTEEAPPRSSQRPASLARSSPRLDRRSEGGGWGAIPGPPIKSAGPSRDPPSKEKVTLRHRQHPRRLACEPLAIGPHRVRLRVHLDPRQRVVVDHIALADRAARADGDHATGEAQT